MASGKEYLHFILEQLSDLEAVSYQSMMGEFILYYRGKIVGGIYDDRLLVKKTRSALELMPAAICELPYEGAKEMLLVDEVDSKQFLTELLKAMASSKDYLHFILEQLSNLGEVSYRPMMGEFILYYRGKIIGGIYDDRLLVKKTRSALELMPAAICELPYEGAKEMLLVDEVDSKAFLTKLFEAMYDELPSPKAKR